MEKKNNSILTACLASFFGNDIYIITLLQSIVIHYQKIDKYKRKYRGNISVGKFPRDFTDGNIPSIYTEGITVGKKIKTKQKKNDDVSFLPTDSVGKFVGKLWTLFIMLITKGITDGTFRQYFPESKSPTDWKVVGVIWRFSEKIQLI